MHILIADDEPIIRLGLRAMLEEIGHAVTMANNGQEALQMARRQPFDLAILDIKMPYTNGLQAAKTMHKINPLPIIMLSAYSEQDLVEEAADLPIQGYLVKPVQKEQLAALITVAYKRFAEMQATNAKVNEMAGRLAQRKLINRAKSKLMAGGISEEQAYRTLQQQARRSRRPVYEIALTVLNSE